MKGDNVSQPINIEATTLISAYQEEVASLHARLMMAQATITTLQQAAAVAEESQ